MKPFRFGVLLAIVAATAGCGFFALDTDTRDAVFKAAESGDVEALAKALQADPEMLMVRASDYQTLLHHAVTANQRTIVETLLAKGAAIEAVDDQGQTPLHFAAYHDLGAMADILLEHGANVNAKNKSGRHALALGGRYESSANGREAVGQEGRRERSHRKGSDAVARGRRVGIG